MLSGSMLAKVLVVKISSYARFKGCLDITALGLGVSIFCDLHTSLSKE